MGVSASAPCPGTPHLSSALVRRKPPEYYRKQGHAYFDLLTSTDGSDAHVDSDVRYSAYLVRWEWEPWLLLTAKNSGCDLWRGIDAMEGSLIPSEVPASERYCRIYPRNPYCRMMVKFYYPNKEQDTCPTCIYEEFSFNDKGEISFIEAWSYPERTLSAGVGKGYLHENKDDPVTESDKGGGPLTEADKYVYWPRMAQVYRMSTRVPGLGFGCCRPLVSEGREPHPLMRLQLTQDSGPARLGDFYEKYCADFSSQFVREYDLSKKDERRFEYLQEMLPRRCYHSHLLESASQLGAGSLRMFMKFAEKTAMRELRQVKTLAGSFESRITSSTSTNTDGKAV